MDDPNLWYAFFVGLMSMFVFVVVKSKNRTPYLSYFVFGAIFGFGFDFVSVWQNYYTYYQYFPSVLGVPLTVTIAEGFAVSVVVYVYMFLKSCWSKKDLSLKNLP